MKDLQLLSEFLKESEKLPFAELKDFLGKIETLKSLLKKIEEKQVELEKQSDKLKKKMEGVDSYIEEVDDNVKDKIDSFEIEKQQAIQKIKDWATTYQKKEINVIKDSFETLEKNVSKIKKEIEKSVSILSKNQESFNEIQEQMEKKIENNNVFSIILTILLVIGFAIMAMVMLL
jgi:chromosome segregation ATPase